MMRFVAGCLAAVSLAVVTGCSTTTGPLPAESSPSGSPTVSVDPVTVIPRSGVIYLRAWAATDVPTMIAAAVPGSPAWNFAQYWNDAYRAGRLDSGAGVVTVRPRWVSVQFGSDRYRFTGAQTGRDGRLVTWRSQPGGPLADRVVAGEPASVRVGRVRVTARYQYVNGEGDLRVSLRIVAPAPDDLAALRYQPGGRTATLGSQGTTGVITVKKGVNWAIASVESAEPGGALALRTYDASGNTTGRGTLRLSAGR